MEIADRTAEVRGLEVHWLEAQARAAPPALYLHVPTASPELADRVAGFLG